MRNLLCAISIEQDLGESNVKKISPHSTLQLDESERLLLCFCLHTCFTLVFNNGRMKNKPYL